MCVTPGNPSLYFVNRGSCYKSIITITISPLLAHMQMYGTHNKIMDVIMSDLL